MKKQINTAGQIVFTFEGDLAQIVFDPQLTHQKIRDHAMAHGFLQRLGDNAAISRKQKDGTVINVTEQMRRDAVAELVNHYESGAENWELRTSKQPAQNPVFLDIATRRNCSYVEAEAWYNEKLVAEMQSIIDAEK